MALYTLIGSDNIPKNSVRLRMSEALKYQKEYVRDWKNATDVIFLRNAKYLAGGLVCASSYFIHKHLSKMFQLRSHVIITYIPVLSLTPVLVAMNFDRKVTDNVLLMEMKCPLCWQLKYCLIQTAAGVVYPFTFGSLICYYSAVITQTIEVPDISKEPKKFCQLIYKFYKNGAMKLKILTSLHILSALFWPYIQNVELKNMTRCLEEESKIYNESLDLI